MSLPYVGPLPRPTDEFLAQRLEHDRDIRTYLRDLNSTPTWGYVIFRTVFTLGSDERFSSFLGTMKKYVDYEIDYELRLSRFDDSRTCVPLSKEPNEEMKRRFECEVVELRELESQLERGFESGVEGLELRDGRAAGESREDTQEKQIRAVRLAFRNWLLAKDISMSNLQRDTRHRVCLMVDESVLRSADRAPDDPAQEEGERDVAWVRVVEYVLDGSEGGENGDWKAWVKVSLRSLQYFWFQLFSVDLDPEDLEREMREFGEEVYMG